MPFFTWRLHWKPLKLCLHKGGAITIATVSTNSSYVTMAIPWHASRWMSGSRLVVSRLLFHKAIEMHHWNDAYEVQFEFRERTFTESTRTFPELLRMQVWTWMHIMFQEENLATFLFISASCFYTECTVLCRIIYCFNLVVFSCCRGFSSVLNGGSFGRSGF